MTRAPSTGKTVLVAGCGVFGVSAAIGFLEQGYQVRIVDRALMLPAVDAASFDLNKIIRCGDYADADMAWMSLEAVTEWRKPEWEGCFHETGVLLTASGLLAQDAFTKGCFENLAKFNIPAVSLNSPEALLAHFPKHLHPVLSDFKGKTGYWNPQGGWVEAERAVVVAMKRVLQLGGRIDSGMEVKGLVVGEERGKRKVRGLRLKSEEILEADIVVIATGAWTGSLFPSKNLGINPLLTATGQCVAKIQLTPEEIKIQEQMPVVLDFTSGHYAFPPNPEGIVKSAIHGKGYVNPSGAGNISTPRTVLTPGAEPDLMIPTHVVSELRSGLAEFFPLLGKKDFTSTRMCWYTDTESGEFLIDNHPDIDGLLVATGGSGHGFKFLPTLHKYIFAVYAGTISKTLARKWSLTGRGGDEGADHRPDGDRRKLLLENELVQRHELRAKL